MTRSKRMDPVVRIAKHREDHAAGRMGEAQRQLQSAQEQLAILKKYRDDYAGHFNQTGANGMDARQLAEFREFLHKLNQAIDGQTERVKEAEAFLAEQQQQWRGLHTRRRALNNVQTRFMEAEHKEADRQEQKNLDERNSQKKDDN